MNRKALAHEEKYEGFPFGILNQSSPWTGACSGRIVRGTGPFMRTLVTALLAVLNSRFGSFVAIKPISSAFGRWKRLAARV